jgi:GNAT superfamily N-acetyltransferase
VTSRLTATEAFDHSRHNVEAFSCGTDALDRWLRAYASQSQHRDAARTFVTTEAGTAGVRRGLSRHFPIPVALLARLAVATPSQGVGLGRSLLLDALQRVVRASDELAIRAVTVDALDERAASFYRAFGFEPSELTPDTLMVPLGVVRQVLEP